MANYLQELAQGAVCQNHTGDMTGLWFLPTRPLRLNTNEWMEWPINVASLSAQRNGVLYPPRNIYRYSRYLLLLESESTPEPRCGLNDCVNENELWISFKKISSVNNYRDRSLKQVIIVWALMGISFVDRYPVGSDAGGWKQLLYMLIPYILKSNPHPNLIRTSFCRFLKWKKKQVQSTTVLLEM